MSKTKIFISHSTPSDNYFATWLASKLKQLGYEVWIELDELRSGDAFWPKIESAIRNDSVKFLPIISKGYMERIRDPYSGVFKELSCADRIKDIQNFKSPLRLDDINFDEFPVQLLGLNSIDFYNNWQEGLEKLLDSFDKEKVPLDKGRNENPLNFWLDSFEIKDIINQEAETIYTNWFPFKLPLKLYVHKCSLQNRLDLVDIFYPYIDYSDRHICFFPSSDYPSSITCISTTEFIIEEILEERMITIDDYMSIIEPRKKIIELVNKTLSHLFIQKRLKQYTQSKSEVFYYPNTPDNKKRISLKSIGKNNVAITGRTKENYWSFGVSSNANLHPFPYLKISSHIVFENKESIVLPQEEQHTLRRKYGFDWYNRDWLDTLLGMMTKIADMSSDNKINILINSRENLVIDAIPFNLRSAVGYFEPSKDDSNEY